MLFGRYLTILNDFDLQDVVDCANEGNTIALETTTKVQPHHRINITKALSIIGHAQEDQNAVNFTCPYGEGVFLVT